MIKIAIITRVKDRPLFMERALKSVESQTFSDYVHIIVNDGGNVQEIDNLYDGLSEKQRQKTRVFHRPESSNAPDTILTESIDRVDSEYFAIHDSDDSWHPDFLKLTVEALDGDGSLGATVVRTDKVIEQVQDGEIIEKKRTQYMSEMRAVSLYRQCIDNQLTPIATLFRRSAYESVGKFSENLPVIGDWEFSIRLLEKYDVGFIDPGYALANYHHRKDGDQVSNHKQHRYYMTKIMNQRLREELELGKFGVGYIMNDLRYQQDFLTAKIKSFVPKPISSFIRKRTRD